MKKTEKHLNGLNARLKTLKELGLDKEAQNLLETSVRFQLTFLSLRVVLEWLDEQILKSKNIADKSKDK